MKKEGISFDDYVERVMTGEMNKNEVELLVFASYLMLKKLCPKATTRTILFNKALDTLDHVIDAVTNTATK
ncbi:MAG: hypothetical protein K2Y32_00385 [Candidatus Obscuribacterales bacterium]|nr:hypothetical protein [Candidatus Obscuribacterales bacterium]